MLKNFFLKSCCLKDNVDKYDTDGQAADDSIVLCLRAG